MTALLAAASEPFYTHDKLGGYLLVALFCGSMILWCCYVAYRNFGPPAKHKGQETDRS
jgi:hypothetical protein